MEKTILISLPIEDLQSVIIDCVNSCLRNNNGFLPYSQPETDQLLTVQGAAEFLSLSVPTVYGLISKGELPVMKRSKRCYFSKKDLMAYLRQGRKITNRETEQVANDYLTAKAK